MYSEDLQSRRAKRSLSARRRKVSIGVASGALIVLLGGSAAVWATSAMQENETPSIGTPEGPSAPEPVPKPEPEPEPAPALDLDSPESITVVVNKQRPLSPIDWAPDDLVWPEVPNQSGHPMRAQAAAALEEMYAAAAGAGVPFTVTSGYRPYDMQVSLFDAYVQRDGV